MALHGYGDGDGDDDDDDDDDADWPFDRVHVERQVAQTGLAVATVDGGNSYWHARRSGVDPASIIVQELLPLLARKGLDTERIALMGWSMGGYGALLLASRLGGSG